MSRARAPRVHTREVLDLSAQPGARVRDRILDRCEIRGAWIWQAPGKVVTAERIELRDCKFRALRGCAGVVCRDIVVRGVRRGSALVRVENCLFDRVRFEGAVGRWFLNWIPHQLDAARLRAAAKFYAGVEYALDLRDARFDELCVRGVPGHLILRDPRSSLLVDRARLEADRSWCVLDEWGQPAPGVSAELDLFLDARPRYPSCVLFAHDREERAALARLRKRGFGA